MANKMTDAPEGSIYEDLLPLLSPVGREFLETEYGRGQQAYLDRLAFIGLDRQGKVLDAGGGIGQWAMALAQTNDSVDVIDLMPDRLLVGHLLAQRSGLTNVHFRQGSIENLPYADKTFDGAICYSVMMFANGPRTMKEFARVLKPGGRLYVMIDLWRWYASQFAPMKRWKSAAVLLAKGALGRGTTFYSPSSFEKLVSAHGFEIVSQGQDGFATFRTEQDAELGQFSFYPSQPKGSEQLWEVCAIRREGN